MTPRTIAVGYDGSADSDVAVRWAFGLASGTGAEVTVVHAAGLLEHLESSFSREQTPPALVDLAKECGLDATRLHWRIDDGDPCSVLLRTMSPPLAADLVVVGTRGQGQHPGLFLGSTSLKLAEHATAPLVIVPSPLASRASA